MASSKEGDAAKRFLKWGDPLINAPNTCKKNLCEVYEWFSRNGGTLKSSDTEKRTKSNSKQLLFGDWQVWKQFHVFGPPR